MKEARSWIITNGKGASEFNFAASSTTNNTSEERAFAEDAAGCFVWPPRYYYCSFCGREFRSAQALGGHMNVHRRDRARLHQSPSPQGTDDLDHKWYQSQSNFADKPMTGRGTDQVCKLINYGPTDLLTPLPKEDSSVVISRIKKHDKISFASLSPRDFDSSKGVGHEEGKKRGDQYMVKEVRIEDSLSLDFGCKKKRKRNDKETLPLYMNPSSSSTIKCNLQSQIKTSAMDQDVDLELRLGNYKPKKVKSI